MQTNVKYKQALIKQKRNLKFFYTSNKFVFTYTQFIFKIRSYNNGTE